MSKGKRPLDRQLGAVNRSDNFDKKGSFWSSQVGKLWEVIRSTTAPGATSAGIRRTQTFTLIAVVVPWIGFLSAAVLAWNRILGPTDLVLFFVMYLIAGFGVTGGYHRLFTHRSFACPSWVRFLFGVAGSMAVQGPLFFWVATHRRHHQYSDNDGDPHSPCQHGEGVGGMLKGFWHAHLGWMFHGADAMAVRSLPDLSRDKTARVIHRGFVIWALVGVVLPAVLGGLITWSWFGALTGFLWGGLARIFVAHHATWSVNSICHMWGARAFETRDGSRNNPAVAIVSLGEGWHNNHHAYPQSARHGLRWFQFDPTWILIWTLSRVRLAWNVQGVRSGVSIGKA
jgi:stearoyl-CoA desaturase (delta-9 desaturase)